MPIVHHVFTFRCRTSAICNFDVNSLSFAVYPNTVKVAAATQNIQSKNSDKYNYIGVRTYQTCEWDRERERQHSKVEVHRQIYEYEKVVCGKDKYIECAHANQRCRDTKQFSKSTKWNGEKEMEKEEAQPTN